MATISRTLFALALALGLGRQAAAEGVICNCEHLGSPLDGICEVAPIQEETATLWTYNQFLLGARSWYEVPLYKYVFTPYGGATLGNYNQFSDIVSYGCGGGFQCRIEVDVYKYADPATQSGLTTGGYPTLVGHSACHGH
jgi:hypothetical protein